MAEKLSVFLTAVILCVSFILANAQESINAAEGVNVLMHAGLALLVCFGILASCTVGINLCHKFCAKKII